MENLCCFTRGCWLCGGIATQFCFCKFVSGKGRTQHAHTPDPPTSQAIKIPSFPGHLRGFRAGGCNDAFGVAPLALFLDNDLLWRNFYICYVFDLFLFLYPPAKLQLLLLLLFAFVFWCVTDHPLFSKRTCGDQRSPYVRPPPCAGASPRHLDALQSHEE